MREADSTDGILLIDQDRDHAHAVCALARNNGFKTTVVDVSSTGRVPVESIQPSRLGIVAVDDAPAQIAQLRALAPTMPIVAMGEPHAVDEVLECIRAGACDYVYGSIESQSLHARLSAHFASCKKAINKDETSDHGIVGGSRELTQLRALISRIASSDVSTLIEGPTGAGKEMVALALHRSSQRADKPLIALNCAALPDDLIEGELFGYEKGAFSGAVNAYPGKLALADGGTLFLDEIGELSEAGQAKLLRAIEARECYRLGGRTPHSFDVRVIAATNRNLETEVAEGRFRSDLFYRIVVAKLSLSGLASRQVDIAPLARHFLRKLWKGDPAEQPRLSDAAVTALESHSWPGNARELRNAIEVALISTDGNGVVRVRDLPSSIGSQVDSSYLIEASTEEHAATALTPSSIKRALSRYDGNKSAAARALGCSRMTLYRHLRTQSAQSHALTA